MHSDASTFPIALLGYGTVGSALHRLLIEHRDHIYHVTGSVVDVRVALVRDATRVRNVATSDTPIRLVDSIDEVFGSEPALVCEAMGGVDDPRQFVSQALERGIPVVTANKQLIARHGAELFEIAQEHSTQLRFEASVCGAIPIIRILRESLAASRIDSVVGILNGTTNYMLSSMTDDGGSYSDALANAQRLGYAEPDPTDDVTGLDAAAKLAILAGIAFQTRVDIDRVACVGITDISAEDISHARELGYRIKLLGRAERIDGRLRVEISPTLVGASHPLATVSGSTNAVTVTGSPFGRIVIQGPGAGGPETASAMAGDIVSAMGSRPSFLTRDPYVQDVESAPASSYSERFYVRMSVPDRPGVLASVSAALADRSISVERLIQERSVADTATLVLTTHPAPRPAIDDACATFRSFGFTTSLIPILEELGT